MEWIMFAATFAFVFLFVWFNLRQALRHSSLSRQELGEQLGIEFSPLFRRAASVIAGLLIAWVAADAVSDQWDSYRHLRHGASFGATDPIYRTDHGSQIFRLAYYQLLQTSLMLLTIVTILWVSAIYAYVIARQVGRSRATRTQGRATSHVSALLLIFIANWGFGLWLDHDELALSTVRVGGGAGYTADQVARFALWGMVGVSVVAGVLLLVNIFHPRMRALLIGTGIYVTIYAFAILLVPSIFQEFVVVRSELAFQTPFLHRDIGSMRQTDDQGRLRETEDPALSDLTPATTPPPIPR
jgi:uncharacterized membrane protein (UPF0182 family)